MLLLLFADIFQNKLLKKNLSETLSECQNGWMDPDQDLSSVGPDLSPNHLQRLSADDKSHC